jgi:uncharacterized membrane protein
VQRWLAAVLTTGALLWSLALFVAPAALTSRNPRVVAGAALVYEGAGLICHQRPERSFHLRGVQQPVCARCTGLYLAGAAGSLAAWAGARRRLALPRPARAQLALASIPTALTFAAEQIGMAHPSNAVRAVSAIPLGAMAGWVFVRSLRAEARLRLEYGEHATARSAGDAQSSDSPQAKLS